MSRKIFLLIPVFLFLLLSFTLKGYIEEDNKDAIWIYINYPLKNIDCYLEVSIDGDVLLKCGSGKNRYVRQGSIKKMYAKDFFRETKSSDVLNYGRNLDLTKLIFYKGELIKISCNIQGEIRRVVSPIERFSQTFIYAFRQVLEQANKLPITNKYVSFIYATPLVGELYDTYLRRVPSGYKLPIIETRDLKINKYIFNAINSPFRLIPIPSKEEEGKIVEFMTEKKLYGLKSAFYIGTTRGNFQLSIIE